MAPRGEKVKRRAKQQKLRIDLGSMLTIEDSLEALRRLVRAMAAGENVEDYAAAAEVVRLLLESQIEEARLEGLRLEASRTWDNPVVAN
jgi:hypothetical protein